MRAPHTCLPTLPTYATCSGVILSEEEKKKRLRPATRPVITAFGVQSCLLFQEWQKRKKKVVFLSAARSRILMTCPPPFPPPQQSHRTAPRDGIPALLGHKSSTPVCNVHVKQGQGQGLYAGNLESDNDIRGELSDGDGRTGGGACAVWDVFTL